MNNKKIGVFASHGEQVVITNPQYQIFFDMLGLVDVMTETITETSTQQSLAQYSSLLLGEPHKYIPSSEINAIQSWIKEGGNLFVMATNGGDKCPTSGKYVEANSNIGQLLPGINFKDNLLGYKLDSNEFGRVIIPFLTKLRIDVPFIEPNAFISNDPVARINYDTGCSFTFDENAVGVKKVESLVVPTNGLSIQVRFSPNTDQHISFTPPISDSGLCYLRYQWGHGSVIVMGSSWWINDEAIAWGYNVEFLNHIFIHWLPNLSSDQLVELVNRPQRHRLLNGYPMPASAKPMDDVAKAVHKYIDIDPDKGLIIGVLPHTYCNPMVKGCGFCTFPHEPYNKSKVVQVVDKVCHEIKDFGKTFEVFRKKKVDAIYIGGGTANLTPVEDLDKILDSLSETFDIENTEISLEGVPKYFLTNNGLLQSIVQKLPKAKRRVSIGIQTFKEEFINLMGRRNFGNEETFSQVVELTRSLGFDISCDLLFDLPGQTIDEMISDVKKAIALDFDQICIYHLVLFRLLGTEWSKNPDLINSLPSNEVACENWLVLRDLLLANGYVQNTVTNFEKKSFVEANNGFKYETDVMNPERFDWVGFGPSAISSIHDGKFKRGFKFHNPTSAEDYLKSDLEDAKWERYYYYQFQDEKVLYITRKIALCKLSISEFNKLFKSNFVHDFPNEISALAKFGLIEINGDEMLVTAKGQFYSDSIAAVFALSQERSHRMRNKINNVAINPNDEYANIKPYYPQSLHMC
jgi:oxygen-independent coproporphyrinogen-3 oxidase